MKTFNLNFSIIKAFKNLKRDKTVNVVLKNHENKYVLGAKPQYYPKGIYRLLGGGVDSGESVQKAAVREIREEIGVDLSPGTIEHIGTLDVSARDSVGKNYSTIIELVFINTQISDYKISDEIGGFIELDEQEFTEMIKRYENLSNGLSPDMNWGDYGKVYAEVHRIALELTKDKRLN